MSESVRLLIPLIAGVFLGVLYFTGLWLTARKLPDRRRPFASIVWSFLARASIVVIGFYVIMNGRGDQLASSLLGFLIAREILIRRLGGRTS